MFKNVETLGFVTLLNWLPFLLKYAKTDI